MTTVYLNFCCAIQLLLTPMETWFDTHQHSRDNFQKYRPKFFCAFKLVLFFPGLHGAFSGIQEYDAFKFSWTIIQAMAKMLKLTLRKIDQAFGCPPFNYTLQTAPLGKEHFNSPHFHWHLDIFPRLPTCGDFRIGSGYYFNPVAPEKAAEFLRNVEVEPL